MRRSDVESRDVNADLTVVVYSDLAVQGEREREPPFQAIPAVADERFVAVEACEGGPDEAGALTLELRSIMTVESLPWVVDTIANDWLAEVDLG